MKSKDDNAKTKQQQDGSKNLNNIVYEKQNLKKNKTNVWILTAFKTSFLVLTTTTITSRFLCNPPLRSHLSSLFVLPVIFR